MVQNKLKSSSSNNNNPSYQLIPQDIMDIHILPKLPVKSIIRFKSISKHYNSLISSPTFAKNLLQLHLSSASPSIFIQTTQSKHAYGPSKFLTIDIEPEPEPEPNAHDRIGNLVLSEYDHGYDLSRFRHHLIGSCNGLICIILDPKDYIDGRSGYYTFFLIWNPMTSETRVIKFPVISYQSEVLCFGFGYDSSSDDYTIVALVEVDFQPPPWVYLFSLRSTNDSGWRKFVDPELKNVSEVGRPTLAGETLYWLKRDKRNSDNSYILTFDIARKSWSFLRIPEPNGIIYPDHDKNSELLLCEIKQCLCAYWVHNIDQDRQHMEAWMLELSDGVRGRWKRLFHFRYSEIRYANQCHLFMPQHQKDMVFILTVDDLKSVHAQEHDHHQATHRPLLLGDGCSFKSTVNYTKSLISPFYNWSYHPRTRKGKKNCLDAFKKKADEYINRKRR